MWAFFYQFFVSPPFLLGLSAVAIPIILHLRFRRTAVEVPFPSIKLLQLSTRRMAHRKKVEELLLLIVRVLLLACLALALAKPFIKSSGLLASRTKTTVALVVDNSGSMAARVGGQRRIDVARARAEAVLAGFPAGQVQAGVFLACGADDTQPGQVLTSNLDDVRNLLGKLEPSPRRVDLAGALARALDALAASNEPHRELYVITDLQRYGLREALDLLPARDRIPNLCAVLLPVAPGNVNDVAVVDLQATGRAMLAQTPFQIEATLKNLGERDRDVQTELLLDGVRSGMRRVKIGGGSTTTISFPARFQDAGLKTASVQVEEDDNPLNDRRVLALPLEDAVRVLLIESAGSALESQNASFYVARALDPFGAATGAVSSGIRPLKLPDSALLTEDLARHRVVFVLNPGKLSLEAIVRLRQYVRSGGGLVIFPGEATQSPGPGGKPDGARFTQDLGLSIATKGQAGEGLLPARVGTWFGKLESQQGRNGDAPPAGHVVDMTFTHPVLAPFRLMDRSAFTSIQVHAGYELAVPTGGPADTLIMLDGQRPLLVGGPAGGGEVFLFAVAPTPDWTNLPAAKGNIFLPLLHTLCHHLASRRVQSESRAVGKYDLRPAAAEVQEASVFAPDNQERKVRAEPGQPLTADLDRVGVWRVVLPVKARTGAAKPAEPEVQALSVNADAKEADNDHLAPQEIQEALTQAADQVFVADDPDKLLSTLRRIREGVPLWNFFLLLVLGLAVLEVYLGGRVKQGAEGKAGEGKG